MTLKCCLVLVCVAPLIGQKDSGELRLAVKDASGAAVAASVEGENQAANIRQKVRIPATGQYSFRNLPFGFYAVRITHDGLAPATATIEIRSEVPVTRDVTMTVAGAATAVEVKAANTLVDPDRTGGAYHV